MATPSRALAQTGTISGTVTDEDTGLPIAGALVSAVTVNGGNVASGTTDGSGNYSLTVPDGALYFVTARGSFASGHVLEAHPDVSCFNFFSCSSTDLINATGFAVPPGGAVSGRNFALRRGGAISGTVTNAATGAPLANIAVTAWTRVGGSAIGITTSTNASGVYSLSGLHPGDHYLHTSNSIGFRNEIFDNVPCVACNSTSAFERGTPVPVTSGATAAGRDFALDTGGTISGTVTNVATGAPVQNVSVQAYTREGANIVFAGSANTNASGQYTITGLAGGSYGVLTSTSLLVNEIHNNLLCPLNCSSTAAVDSGTTVAVPLGGTTSGIDFALDPGGSISGTVTNESTGLPVQNAFVVAVVQLGNSTATRSAVTNASGVYTIPGLIGATYALYTSVSGFANEIYDNIPCQGFCNSGTALATGAPVPVTPGATTADRNFALQPAAAATGTITGTLTDSVSGLPIGGITVETYLATGSGLSFAGSTTTNVEGIYSLSNLPAGSYRVATFGINTYRNEVYENTPCLGQFCSATAITGGTPVAVSSGSSAAANIALTSGDGFTGQVTSAATGEPLPGVSVNVYQVSSGSFAFSVTSNRQGTFTVRGLPNGDYVAYTGNSLGFFNEIYNNIQCTAGCLPATALSSGTRITVTDSPPAVDMPTLITGINFALDARTQPPAAPTNLRAVTANFRTELTWTAPSIVTGAAATSYVVEAGFSPGTTIVSLPVTGTSTAVPGVPPGTYYVRVRGVNAFGTGPASNEIVLSVGASGTSVPETPTSLQAFVSGGLLTMTWSPALAGGPATSYVVEVGSTGGASNIANVIVTTTRFVYSPVPNGVYFFRVRARNAAGLSTPTSEVMVVVGNVASPPGPPNLFVPTVTGRTVGLSWQAPTRGTATSYIIEAGSAPGLSNLARVNTGSTATSVSFPNVPPGTYYVRVRAVNAQGIGVASNERTLIVP